jgi:nucleoside-diphosphate-sugar epimerase
MVGRGKPVIALTGATGFLGSHLMASLLQSGYRVVILGRSTADGTLGERIARLMRWFGRESCGGSVESLEIDLAKPRLGLPGTRYGELCGTIDHLVHCASNTSFSETKRGHVFETNVGGLAGILELAASGRAKKLHYISTAYVSGADQAVSRETLPGASGFVNVYEESKARAERIVATFCREKSIPLTIIRPSIVYGDSRTGRSLKFSALYSPVKSVYHIREIYLNDIRNHGGGNARAQGIFLDPEGYLHLPLRIHLPRNGSINLIPVDYFVLMTLKIIEEDSAAGIYHLTDCAPPTFETLVGYNEEFLKIRGIEIRYGREDPGGTRNSVEELFDCLVEPYLPYLCDTRVFERTNTDRITGGARPPQFTYEVFRRCMEFAVRAQWGKQVYAT